MSVLKLIGILLVGAALIVTVAALVFVATAPPARADELTCVGGSREHALAVSREVAATHQGTVQTVDDPAAAMRVMAILAAAISAVPRETIALIILRNREGLGFVDFIGPSGCVVGFGVFRGATLDRALGISI